MIIGSHTLTTKLSNLKYMTSEIHWLSMANLILTQDIRTPELYLWMEGQQKIMYQNHQIISPFLIFLHAHLPLIPYLHNGIRLHEVNPNEGLRGKLLVTFIFKCRQQIVFANCYLKMRINGKKKMSNPEQPYLALSETQWLRRILYKVIQQSKIGSKSNMRTFTIMNKMKFNKERHIIK